MTNLLGRRNFLKFMGGAGAMGAAALAGARLGTGGAAAVSGAQDPHLQQAGGETWQEMDQHHQEVVEIFLAQAGSDPNFFRPAMEPEMDGDVKVFNITCSEIDWETAPGMVFPAMAYNGMVPGPTVRVTEGDRVRFVVTNEMTQSTAIHFHGAIVPNDQDGVPYITQGVITPGSTFSYEFTAQNAGSHMYHSHHNAAEQVTRGLMGAFIIDPADTSREPVADAEYIIILNDTAVGFTLNGKSFPYTQPIIATRGQKIRVRYMNEGLMIHPMHLHGLPQLVFAKDGWHLPVPYMCDTLNVAPGERYDVLIDCTEVGVWAYHCHILTHAESRNGMFGMVTVLIVNE
ncbi:MAG: copper oxidase [Chloroflexi bacterium]|nr:copper oxidase [Chloroflexota bacterium]